MFGTKDKRRSIKIKFRRGNFEEKLRFGGVNRVALRSIFSAFEA